MYDYAHYNEHILGNKSFILSDANSDLKTLKKFQNRFEVFLYDKFQDCFEFVSNNKITNAYFIKAGDDDGKIIPNIKNAIHVVFANKDVHGDRYAYVSEWLANKMEMSGQYVPHVVWLPEPTEDYRKKLNIPKTNIIIGRHGGFNDFDLPFVMSTVYNVAQKRSDVTFLFMNTREFCPSLPNIIHVESTYNLQNKSNYINTCDYMIHARQQGESFGLAISEFLFHDKPVISWSEGIDKNHIDMLGNKGIWYTNHKDLSKLLTNITKNNKPVGFYKSVVEQFSPKKVMTQFDEIFLQ